jgi:hypothetical protein
MECLTQGLVSMIHHKKQFVTWSTTHVPPNAPVEQHRHLSAHDSFGILAFHHFVRILLDAALSTFPRPSFTKFRLTHQCDINCWSLEN